MKHKQEPFKVRQPLALLPRPMPARESWWVVPDELFKAALDRETPRILGQSSGPLTSYEKPLGGKPVQDAPVIEDDE